jgi:hypothetical protein
MRVRLTECFTDDDDRVLDGRQIQRHDADHRQRPVE